MSLHHTYLIAVGEYLKVGLIPWMRAFVQESNMTQESDKMSASLAALERVVDVVLADLAQSKAQVANLDANAKINAQALSDATDRVEGLVGKLQGTGQ